MQINTLGAFLRTLALLACVIFVLLSVVGVAASIPAIVVWVVVGTLALGTLIP